MYRSGETSCSISAMGNSGASACVPGCSGGGGGEGRSGTMLYHCRGSSDSCRTYLTWWSMDASGSQGGKRDQCDTSALPAGGTAGSLPRWRAAADQRGGEAVHHTLTEPGCVPPRDRRSGRGPPRGLVKHVARVLA